MYVTYLVRAAAADVTLFRMRGEVSYREQSISWCCDKLVKIIYFENSAALGRSVNDDGESVYYRQ